MLMIKALVLLNLARAVARYIWRHWTTPGLVSSMLDRLEQSQKLVDDMKAFQQDYGNFPLSQDTLGHLDGFDAEKAW